MLADTGRIESPLIFLMHRLRFRIDQPIHGILRMPMAIAVVIVGNITSHARASPSAPTLAFVVTCERIPSGEATATFRTYMRPLAGMQLGVPFQIMQSPEARLTGLADIRLLLAVGEQMTFEVMMPGKLGRTVRTPVFFGPRGTLPSTATKTGPW